MSNHYLFTSQRLGFRNWKKKDLPDFHAMNTDPMVMRFFAGSPSLAQSEAWIDRMQKMFEERGYCYFAVNLLETHEFIGFIGLAWQDYPAHFTPCTDIGWRLIQKAWGQGFASEGAKRCLEYTQSNLKLTEIKSVAPLINKPSIRVMQKIGMELQGTFKHPKLKDHPHIEECALYQINLPQNNVG